MDNTETTHDSVSQADAQMQTEPAAQAPRGSHLPEKDGGANVPALKSGDRTPRRSPFSQPPESGRRAKPATIRPNIPFAEKRYAVFARELGLLGMRRETVRDTVTTMVERASDRALLRLLREDKDDSGEGKQL